jgi:hypothetical protein
VQIQREDYPSSAPDVRDWLAALETAASAARRKQPETAWLLRIGGVRIHIRASGPAIRDWLEPALSHAMHPAESDTAFGDFELTIWDQAATGVTPPAPFWDTPGWANRGELPALQIDGIVAAYHEDAGYLAAFDPHRRRAWVWVRDAATLPRYERAAPLRGPLSWFFAATGTQFAHAGAVATSDGAALLAGRGGSGKSTTTMVCAGAGLGYLGDDYVLVGTSDSQPQVHAIYSTAKLTEQSFDLLPALRALADGPATPHDKAVLQLAPSQLVASASIAAIVLPRIGEARETRWEPATASQALTALAPTTLFQLPGAGGEALARLARLVRAVPAFTLHLGSDMDGIAPALSACVTAARTRQAAA